MKTKKILFLILFTFTTLIVNAQFKVDAEIRPRFEFNDGVKTLLSKDESPAFVTSQRSRLNLSLTDEKVNIFFSIQDCRIWGESIYKKDVPSIMVNEAWASYAFKENITLKLGRQLLNYDDKRLFGPSDWGTVGATHDLALLKVKGNDTKIDMGFAYNNNVDKKYESNYPLDYYKYLGFVWINKAFSKNFSLSLMNIADGYQKEDSDDTIYSRFTSGFYGNYMNDSSLLSLSFSVYYQYGKSPDGSSVGAYFFSIAPEFKLSKKLKVIAGIDYLSGGDAFSSSNKNKAFSTLYGDTHGYYGHMDYFTSIDEDTQGSGLADLFLSFQHKLSSNTSFEFWVHNFSLTNNAVDTVSSPGNTLKAKKKLGNEIDLMLKHKLSNNVELRVGYSTMLATETMELFKGGDHSKYQQWGWVSLIFKPTLFKTESKKN